MRSYFPHSLFIRSLEFGEYGNAFRIRWSMPVDLVDVASQQSQSTATVHEPIPIPPTQHGAHSSYASSGTDDIPADQQQQQQQAPEHHRHYESLAATSYDRIEPDSWRFLGEISFDLSQLCHPYCYLGIQPPPALASTQLLTSMNNTAESTLYDTWHRSILIHQQNNTSSSSSSSSSRGGGGGELSIDLKLLELYKQRMRKLNKLKHLFRSVVHLNLESRMLYINSRQQHQQQANNKNKLLNATTSTSTSSSQPPPPPPHVLQQFAYSFPIRMNMRWPRLLPSRRDQQVLAFANTQVYTGERVRRVRLRNPTSGSVLVSVSLLAGYPHARQLFDEMAANGDALLFAVDKRHRHMLSATRRFLHSATASRDLADSPFTLTVMGHDDHVTPPMPEDTRAASSSDGGVVVFTLEANETVMLRVVFRPTRIDTFHDAIVVRNNLTVLETCLMSGQSGSAELRLNRVAPMSSSALFAGSHVPVPQEFVDEAHRLDAPGAYSPLVIQMSDEDAQAHCHNVQRLNFNRWRGASSPPPSASFSSSSTHHMSSTASSSPSSSLLGGLYALFDYLYKMDASDDALLVDNFLDEVNNVYAFRRTNNKHHIHIYDPFNVAMLRTDSGNGKAAHIRPPPYKTSFEIKEGVVLRRLFELKNVGTSELNIYNVIFDGEPCLNHGFKVIHFTQASLLYLQVNFKIDIFNPIFTI